MVRDGCYFWNVERMPFIDGRMWVLILVSVLGLEPEAHRGQVFAPRKMPTLPLSLFKVVLLCFIMKCVGFSRGVFHVYGYILLNNL